MSIKQALAVSASGLLLLHCAEAETIKMEMVKVQPDEAMGCAMMEFKGGRFELPFANDAGKLVFLKKGRSVYMDRNLNGKIDEADGHPLKNGDMITVPVKMGDRDVKYCLGYQVDGGARMLVSRSCLRGTYLKQAVNLIDGNANGRFTDKGEDGDEMCIGDITRRSPGDRSLIQFHEQILKASLRDGGLSLDISPSDEPTAKVEAELDSKWGGTLVLLSPTNGLEVEIKSGRAISLPLGAYTVESSEIHGGAKSQNEAMSLSGEGGDRTVTVKSGSNRFEIGPPFAMQINAARVKNDKAGIKIKDVALVGRGGERYRADVEGGGKASLTSYIRSGKAEKKLSDLEWG